MKRAIWLATASAVAMATGVARADEAQILERMDRMQKQLEEQQKQIADQKAEIERLRASVGKKKAKGADMAPMPPPPPPVDVATKAEVEQLRLQVAQQDTRARLEKQEQPLWSIVNLRPTIQSPDGRFSVSVRSEIQLDMANYFQD